ncbi:MAG: hypothetical protein ACFFBH_12970 [Promethearchaeota archaeon]
MNLYKNGNRNGFNYTNNSAKQNIANNEFIKKIRKKLMEEKLKKKFKN